MFRLTAEPITGPLLEGDDGAGAVVVFEGRVRSSSGREGSGTNDSPSPTNQDSDSARIYLSHSGGPDPVGIPSTLYPEPATLYPQVVRLEYEAFSDLAEQEGE